MMTNTAAGMISVIQSAQSAERGGTTLWLGTMADGRFVVTSRFQYEIRTKDLSKAQSVFNKLCGVSNG